MIGSNARDRLIVADFVVLGDIGVPGAGAVIADGLSPAFATRYEVVDRGQIAKLVEDLKISPEALLVDPLARRKLGLAAKAQYIVVGSINPVDGLTAQAAIDRCRDRIDRADRASCRRSSRTAHRESAAIGGRLADERRAKTNGRGGTSERRGCHQGGRAERRPEVGPVARAAGRPPATGDPRASPGAAGRIRSGTARSICSDACEWHYSTAGDFRRATEFFVAALFTPQSNWATTCSVADCTAPRCYALNLRTACFPKFRTFASALRCRPLAPPEANRRPGLAILDFRIVGQSKVAPTYLSWWIPANLAPYLTRDYREIDRAELLWWMGRLGVTPADLVRDHAARIYLARAVDARYFLFGSAVEVDDLRLTDYLVEAATGFLVSGARIQVRDAGDLRNQLGELAWLTTLTPDERRRVDEQSAAVVAVAATTSGKLADSKRGEPNASSCARWRCGCARQCRGSRYSAGNQSGANAVGNQHQCRPGLGMDAKPDAREGRANGLGTHRGAGPAGSGGIRHAAGGCRTRAIRLATNRRAAIACRGDRTHPRGRYDAAIASSRRPPRCSRIRTRSFVSWPLRPPNGKKRKKQTKQRPAPRNKRLLAAGASRKFPGSRRICNANRNRGMTPIARPARSATSRTSANITDCTRWRTSGSPTNSTTRR